MDHIEGSLRQINESDGSQEPVIYNVELLSNGGNTSGGMNLVVNTDSSGEHMSLTTSG